jgi:hypothetical protein
MSDRQFSLRELLLSVGLISLGSGMIVYGLRIWTEPGLGLLRAVLWTAGGPVIGIGLTLCRRPWLGAFAGMVIQATVVGLYMALG